MAKTKSTTVIDPHVMPKYRSGDFVVRNPTGQKPKVGEKLSEFIVVALESALDQIVTQNGIHTKQPTPEELRKRINLANEIEAVADGEPLTMSQEDYKLIEKCVSAHFIPAVSTRILVALSSGASTNEETKH